MAFAADLKRLCKHAGDKAELVVRKTAIELQSSLIERSPVDTGRFRANWQCGIGVRNAVISDDPGSDAKGRTMEVLTGWEPGRTIYLTNSLPYSLRLENGWSQQAPSGMVRLTVQAYGTYLAQVVRELK